MAARCRGFLEASAAADVETADGPVLRMPTMRQADGADAVNALADREDPLPEALLFARSADSYGRP